MNPSALAAMPMRSKLILGAVAVGILLLAFFMIRLAAAPSYTTMLTGLDPADTGKITAALDEQAIAYELQSGGTALAVAEADKAKARIALAGQGLAGGGGAGNAPGFELFDEQKLGASDMQQRVTYQRALEGEIARTVGAVQGVQEPQVQLVMPEEDLFADEATPATAAVQLGNPADTLEGGAVKGIAQLVASSVKGLKTGNVTITDATGQVLWPNGEAAGGGGSKQSAEAKYARGLESRLNAMLSRTLGPDKGTVQVQADLDMDKTTRNELKYGTRVTPLTSETETEQLEGQGGGGAAGGTAGAGGNIPTYGAGGAGGGGDSNYERDTDKTTNGVDKTVSKTDVAQGAVQRLNVALVLDDSVAPAGAAGEEARNAIRDTVATAAGVDVTRGDKITATSLAFAEPPKPGASGELPIPPMVAGLLGPLKWVGITLAAMLFCLFMMRHLKRREGDEIPQPAWLATLDQPVPLASLESGGHPTRVMAHSERQADPSLQRLETLMEREPERVAAQVRQWMDED